MVKPQIFQVVGYQNCGKTTLVSGLIKEWKKHGKKIVTIKHHGHGGKPETVEGKDSSKHIEAGAAASVVEGAGSLILHANQLEHWSLSEQIELLSFFQPDTILIEGHKNAPFPKVVIIRKEDELKLINELENIQAIVYWEESLVQSFIEFKEEYCFSISDENIMRKLAFYLEQVHKKDKKN
ncbi:MAG: molybdopterin-guanine dinucleotide biosynthesis protein B [Bacillota bacterium]|nr:molybdopterin-guanine dinucleotide biosynthesis protein B [Bacillota bacterium]